MHRDRRVEILLGRAHLDRDADHLDHFARAIGDDVAAEDLAGCRADDQLEQHAFVLADKGVLHRPEGGAVDLDLFAFARRFFGQADRAVFRLGEDRRRDVGVIDLGRVAR